MVIAVIGLGTGGCGSGEDNPGDGAVAELDDGADEHTTGDEPSDEPDQDADADLDGSAKGDGAEDGEAGDDGQAGDGDDRTEPHTEPTVDATDARPQDPPGADIPAECPQAVREVGDRITDEFEYIEVPPTEDVAILTCDWRDADDSIASIEVSFSHELVGTDLAEVDGSVPVTVADVDGYVLRAEEDKAWANMFQFHVSGVYITGGSIQVEGVAQGDVLELAAAAIDALADTSR